VIQRVSANFVPVALNLYKVREATDEAGKFFKSVQKQRPAQYQGIYIVSPAGKVLSAQARQPAKPRTWTDDLLEVIDTALPKSGGPAARKVKRVDPLPDRGAGVSRDGSVSLAIYVRLMLKGFDRNSFGSAAIDTQTFTAKEWSALAPAKAEEKSEWNVPPAVGRKLCRLLSPSSDQATLARPEEVTDVRLKGKVVDVRQGIAYLRYTGHLQSERAYPFAPHKGKKVRAEVALLGVGAYDVKARRLLSFTLIGEGTFRNHAPYDYPVKYNTVAQWRLKRP
jgi:hypothetical protein